MSAQLTTRSTAERVGSACFAGMSRYCDWWRAISGQRRRLVGDWQAAHRGWRLSAQLTQPVAWAPRLVWVRMMTGSARLSSRLGRDDGDGERADLRCARWTRKAS
jgi:hypothetical protein